MTQGYNFRCDRPKKPYRVVITINGKAEYRGSFSTPEKAREVYLKARAENPTANKLKSHRPWTDEERENLLRLYFETDLRLKEIGAELNRSIGAIDHQIRRMGVERNKWHK